MLVLYLTALKLLEASFLLLTREILPEADRHTYLILLDR